MTRAAAADSGSYLAEAEAMRVDRSAGFVSNDLRFNGAMAQLGARLHGMQKVASSSLAGSIAVSSAERKNCVPIRVG